MAFLRGTIHEGIIFQPNVSYTYVVINWCIGYCMAQNTFFVITTIVLFACATHTLIIVMLFLLYKRKPKPLTFYTTKRWDARITSMQWFKERAVLERKVIWYIWLMTRTSVHMYKFLATHAIVNGAEYKRQSPRLLRNFLRGFGGKLGMATWHCICEFTRV